MTRPSIFLFVLGTAACSGNGTVTDRYVAFDEAGLSSARAERDQIEGLREVLEGKDFTAIRTAYESGFQAKLKTLSAAHDYVSGGAMLGVTLDGDAEAAIDLGAGTTDSTIQEAAEEMIQTIVSRYEFETIYGSMRAGTEAGWDRAFAFYGRADDGKASVGIASTAVERDTEFAMRKNDAIWQAFIDGRNALAGGDTATVTAKSAAIDLAITEVFGLSAHHEFAEAAEAVEGGMPADAVEGFAVGKGLVSVLRDYMKTRASGATAVATIDAELDKGDVTASASMSQVMFKSVVAAIDSAFGFSL